MNYKTFPARSTGQQLCYLLNLDPSAGDRSFLEEIAG